jgi:hypothetical protein
MELNVRMKGEELPHCLRLVRGKVVGDRWICLPSDCVATTSARKSTNSALVWRGVVLPTTCSGNLQGGVEREGAMPEILKAVALGTHGREGQNRIKPIESLNGALLVHADHGRVGRRLEIEADNIGRPDSKAGSSLAM